MGMDMAFIRDLSLSKHVGRRDGTRSGAGIWTIMYQSLTTHHYDGALRERMDLASAPAIAVDGE